MQKNINPGCVFLFLMFCPHSHKLFSGDPAWAIGLRASDSKLGSGPGCFSLPRPLLPSLKMSDAFRSTKEDGHTEEICEGVRGTLGPNVLAVKEKEDGG